MLRVGQVHMRVGGLSFGRDALPDLEVFTDKLQMNEVIPFKGVVNSEPTVKTLQRVSKN